MALVVVALEIGLRLFAPQFLRRDPVDAFEPFGPFYRPRPGLDVTVSRPEGAVVWRVNSHGSRGPERAYDKPAGTFRIVGLGDSFTFGYTVNDEATFLRRLEAALNTDAAAGAVSSSPAARTGRRFECINLGVGGYGPLACAYMLDREGVRYAPDLIVLAFFVGNDVADARCEAHALDGAPLATALPATFELKRWLGSNLHLYSLVSVRLHRLLIKTGLRRVEQNTIDILRQQESVETSEGWRAVEAALSDVRDRARAVGARFLVVAVPIRHQVNRREWQDLCSAYRLPAAEFDLDKPQAQLAAVCRRLGVPLLDLLPSFRAATASLYNEGEDAHWNAAGHAQAAHDIQEWMAASPPE